MCQVWKYCGALVLFFLSPPLCLHRVTCTSHARANRASKGLPSPLHAPRPTLACHSRVTLCLSRLSNGELARCRASVKSWLSEFSMCRKSERGDWVNPAFHPPTTLQAKRPRKKRGKELWAPREPWEFYLILPCDELPICVLCSVTWLKIPQF